MTNREVKDLMQKYKSVVLFLMETRARKERVEKVRRELRFQHSFCIEAIGKSEDCAYFGMITLKSKFYKLAKTLSIQW